MLSRIFYQNVIEKENIIISYVLFTTQRQIYFIFKGYFLKKKWGRGGGSSEPPGPPLDPPLEREGGLKLFFPPVCPLLALTQVIGVSCVWLFCLRVSDKARLNSNQSPQLQRLAKNEILHEASLANTRFR